MPQPATMSTSQSSPMKKSLYTISDIPVWVMMTGMWTDSFRVPDLMRISMPGLSGSVLVVISILAVLARESSCPLRRML